MFGKIISRFDLVGIQEVQEDLEGVQHLHSRVSGDDLVVSDTTGRFRRKDGMAEDWPSWSAGAACEGPLGGRQKYASYI